MESIKGVYVSLQTPFLPDGRIDLRSLKSEVDFCIRAGCHGLVIPVMAGEFFTLTDKERLFVADVTVKQSAGRVPVMIGVQGLTMDHALFFTENASRIGANSVIAMPPYLRKASEEALKFYFHAIDAVGLPVMIQSLQPPLGTPVSRALLEFLLEHCPNTRYVKEEANPLGRRISTIVGLKPKGLLGVFSGRNGLWLINDLDRGVCGTMPAAPFTDLHVKIWNLYISGDREGARRIYQRLLPILNLGSLYGNTFNKEILCRRGIIAHTYVRDPEAQTLDDYDFREIDEALVALQPDLIV